MNEMIQKICTRHAIRRFEDRQLEESTLEEILTAGLYAPSAGNNQQSRIVVCQNPEVNAELGKISRYMQFKGGDPKKMSHAISAEQPSIQDDHTILNGFYDAPTVLTIFARPGQYAHDDAAMIAENILLAAHFLGVGGCYIRRSEEVLLRRTGARSAKNGVCPKRSRPSATWCWATVPDRRRKKSRGGRGALSAHNG